MKVLFWIDAFPTYSETFIRDQIMSLLDLGIEVVIYPKNGTINKKELDALSGFESYDLLQKVVNIDSYYSNNKIERLLKFLPILILSIFSKSFKFYYRSLNFIKYGSLSKSLRLFFRVHFMLKNNIEIMHAHFGPNGNNAAVFKTLGLPIKLFTTFHGYDIRLGLKKGGYIYNNLFKEVDGIFSISDYNSDCLLGFGVSKSKLISLANGINVVFFKRSAEISKLGVIKFLTVARLVEEKALHIAIKALYELSLQKPDLEFEYTIVGDGEKYKALQGIILELKLSNHIKLVGSKHSIQVRDLMIHSDLFLLPSQAEALPTVLLEAQAAEMIVLATDVGSVIDIVRGGLVVAPKDIEAFRKGIIQLLEKRNQWFDIAKAGRDYVCEFHDIKLHTKKMMSYYKYS